MHTVTRETARATGHAQHPLEREARELMTPGVVTIVEDSSLGQVYRALQAHRVHALLVLGCKGGHPLGWVTSRGLLAWLEKDESMAFARDAITQPPLAVDPSALGREALTVLSQPGISHVLVQRSPDVMPEGVISDFDLIPASLP